MFHVTVYLDPAAFCLQGPAMKAVEFDVDAAGVDEALDTTYAVCNSYPEEMSCPPAYADVVATYRAFRYRSLSVGDRVRVQGTDLDRTFRCDGVGWSDAESPEDETPEAGAS